MAGVQFTTQRFVKATNARGEDCKICMVIVRHENGHLQTLAINEDLLRFEAGGDPEKEERVILHEIRQAAL